MVTLSAYSFMRILRGVLVFAGCALLLAGCASPASLTVRPEFIPPAEIDTVYVIPFNSALVPEEIQEAVFNELVDILNDERKRVHVQQFEIIKDDISDLDSSWLGRQLYIKGEIWSYIENAGCCQTELRIRSRISIFAPGKETPGVEFHLPMERFFDHDLSTLEKEKARLTSTLARELANRIIQSLSPAK